MTDGARLSRLSEDDADTIASLCCMGLQLERELDELIWESPTIGLGHPPLLSESIVGRVIKSAGLWLGAI